jgi:hypothetical protein
MANLIKKKMEVIPIIILIRNTVRNMSLINIPMMTMMMMNIMRNKIL